jgi:hypothetical protein
MKPTAAQQTRTAIFGLPIDQSSEKWIIQHSGSGGKAASGYFAGGALRKFIHIKLVRKP